MGLIRTSLEINISEEGVINPAKIDSDIRKEVERCWAGIDPGKLSLVVPDTKGKMTVGKVYGSLLIFDHWKAQRQRKRERQLLSKNNLDKNSEGKLSRTNALDAISRNSYRSVASFGIPNGLRNESVTPGNSNGTPRMERLLNGISHNAMNGTPQNRHSSQMNYAYQHQDSFNSNNNNNSQSYEMARYAVHQQTPQYSSNMHYYGLFHSNSKTHFCIQY